MKYFDRLLRYLRIQQVRHLIKKGIVLCDLGCGEDAFFLKSVAPVVQSAIGLDSRSINYKIKNLEIKKCDLNKSLPVADNSIDVVTCLATLEHIENYRGLLNESYRILKRGGLLLITVPTVLGKPIIEILSVMKIINSELVREHKHYYSKNSLKENLMVIGFKNIIYKYFELGCNLFLKAEK